MHDERPDEELMALVARGDATALESLYSRWERALGHRPKSFLRLGSGIGGDRDGNPNVVAASLEYALGTASQAVLDNYLEQLHALGAELSISTELAASWQTR